MRRALKISAWTVGSLVLLCVLLLLTVLIIGNTDAGRRLIERLADRFTAGHVQLAQLSGPFPAALDLGRLQLSDDQGVWLTAEHISLRWSPWALLARHVRVESLSVARLDIERPPVTQPKKKKKRSFSIPHTDLDRLSVDTLQLGAGLVGRPTSLVVRGNAHLLSLQDATAAVAAHRTGDLGDYELRLRLDPARMDATLQIQEPANGPLQNILTLPGLGDLSALVKITGPRTAEDIELTLDAGAAHGRVRGTVDLKDTSANLQYAFDAARMAPARGLSWENISLHGHWEGTLKQGAADGQLQLRSLQVPGGLQLAALNASLSAKRGLLRLHSVIEGLTIPGSQPDLLRESPLTVDAAARLDERGRPVDLSAAHRLFTLSGRAVTAGNQSAQLDLRVPDVAPLGAFARQKISGNVAIKAQLERSGSDTRLTADLTGNIDGGTTVWAGVLRGGPTRLQLAGTLNEKEVSIQRLSLTAPAITAALSGTAARADTRDLNIRLDASLSDLAKVSSTLAGTLKLSGKLSGPEADLSTTVQLTSTLSVRGSPSGTVTASLRANGLPRAPRGDLNAHGSLDGAPLNVDVSLAQEGNHTVHAIVHSADWKSAHIKGDLSAPTDAAGSAVDRATGNLRLEMSQLADLNRLFGSSLQGGISGQLSLRPGRGGSTAQLQLDARNVVAGSFTTNAQLSAAGTMHALNVKLAAQSPNVAGLPADVTASSTVDVGARELQLTSLEAHYHEQKLHLLSPARLSLAGGVAIGHLRLGLQEATLEIDGRVSPELDVRTSLKQVKPALINTFIPDLLAAGTIQADAQVKGSFKSPQGTVHVDATGMRSAANEATGLPATDFHLTTQLMGNTAEVDAKLVAGKASQITLNGEAPLAPDGALNLRLLGTTDIAVMNPLLEATGKHVTGQVKLDTRVTGSENAPQVAGTVRLSGGSMRDYLQGTNLTDINGEITGNQRELRIEKLTARAAPGDVSVTGTIGVLEKGIPVELELHAKNAQPVASNIVTANLNSDITVKGTLRERLDVAGKVYVNRADVQIPNGLPPNVAVLDVRRPGEAAPPPSDKRLIIGLNISVDAPRQILVKGRGLDAELGGEIRIRGTTASPTVSGGFELLRGTFTLASGHLTFTQGTVTFNGAGLQKKIDPTLDFVAQTQVVDVTATVRVTGLADSPKIELSSTPDLPQDEILARLLFGVSASQLTALQVVQIGAALASLGGGGGGFNPLEKIQKTLGLDRLTVAGGSSSGPPGSNNTANTGASIEAGRYVSSRVFVGVKESTTGTTQLAVDVDLAKRLKLQARVGNGTATAQGTTPENDPGSSLGIAYQWEY
jgi:translocation and assembly module TamB